MSPELTLRRVERTARATFGELWIDGQRLAITLEDPPGEGKGPIPAGSYPLVLTYSERFRALLPEIRDIPGRTAIRIHAGNTSADTTGCVLVGLYRVDDGMIGQSRDALARVLRIWREWVDQDIRVTEEASP